MSGKRLTVIFLIGLAAFVAGLVYTQFYAYYERVRGATQMTLGDARFAVRDLDMIDAGTSPLKLRACFIADPAAFDGYREAQAPTPLTPPPWFDCFDPEAIARDIGNGAARAVVLGEDTPRGFDALVAIYPDGRGYGWRQLNATFAQ